MAPSGFERRLRRNRRSVKRVDFEELVSVGTHLVSTPSKDFKRTKAAWLKSCAHVAGHVPGLTQAVLYGKRKHAIPRRWIELFCDSEDHLLRPSVLDFVVEDVDAMIDWFSSLEQRREILGSLLSMPQNYLLIAFPREYFVEIDLATWNKITHLRSLFDEEVEMRAQSADEPGYIARILSTVTEWITGAGATVSDFGTRIGRAIAKTLEMPLSACGAIGSTLSDWLESLFGSWFMGVLKGFADKAVEIKNWIQNNLKTIVVWIVSCVFVVLGWRSGFANSVHVHVSQSNIGHAQGADDVAAIVGTASALFGLSLGETNNLASKCKNLLAIFSFSAVAVKAGAQMMTLLPLAFQHGLMSLFGTANQKLDMELDDYRSESQLLLAISKVPSVISSETFHCRLSASVDRGYELAEKCGPQQRAMIANLYFRQLSLLSMTTKFREQDQTRVVPYCVHVTAPPGIGKTMTMPMLLREAFGLEQREAYIRPMSEQYWNGYKAKYKAVVMDEFLVSKPEWNLGLEYLDLVSSNRFMPPAASVDDPSIGVKGELARPDVVITASNTPWPRHADSNSDALDRRRNKVLAYRINPKFSHLWSDAKKKFDYSGLTEEQLMNVEHIQVSFLPTVHSPTPVMRAPPMWLSFKEAMELVRTDYETHMVTARALVAAYGDETENRSVDDVIEAYSRKTVGLDEFEGKGLFDIVASWFMRSQGKRKRGPRKRKDSKDGATSENSESSQTSSSESSTPMLFSEPDTEYASAAEDNLPLVIESEELGRLNGTLCAQDPNLPQRDMSLRTRSGYTTSTGIGVSRPEECTEKQLHFHNCATCDIDELCPRIIRTPFQCSLCSEDLCGIYTLTKPEDEIIPVDDRDSYRIMAKKSNSTWKKYAREGRLLFKKAKDIAFPNSDTLVYAILWVSYAYYASVAAFVCWVVVKLITQTLTGKRKQGDQSPLRSQASWGQQETKKSGRRKGFRASKMKSQGSGLDKHIVDISCAGINCKGFFVKSKFLLVPAHVCGANEMLVMSNGLRVKVALNDETMRIDEERDAAVIDCSSALSLQPVRDVTGRFMSAAELDEFTHMQCVLMLETPVIAKATFGPGFYTSRDRRVRLDYAAKYRILTREGDCGCPLVSQDPRAANKIVGIHVAGNGEPNAPIGASTTIEKEWIDEALQGFADESTIDEEDIGVIQANDYTEEEERMHDESVRTHRHFIRDVFGWTFPNLNVMCWSQVIGHDMSKFSESERYGYIDKFIRGEDTERWRDALAHHYERNPHHPQNFAGSMPTRYLEESVIDMMARTWEKLGQPVSMAKLAHLTNDPTYLERYTEIDRARVIALLTRIENKDSGVERPLPHDSTFELVDSDLAGNNLVKTEKVPKDQQVFLPTRSVLKRSAIAAELAPQKDVPIMHQYDPRAKGFDPVAKGVQTLCAVENGPVDADVLKECAEDLFEHYSKNLENPLGRPLTFEEAVKGVPGVLKGLDLSTSPGYPLALTQKGSGKREFVNINEQGELWVAPGFKEACLEHLESFEDWAKENNHVYLGYLKDELMSASKIEEVRTRLIYASDLMSTIAFRMRIGGFLAAFHSSYGTTESAIGLNQNSHDMQLIKDYLDEVEGPGYIAGDAKEWDKRLHRDFLVKAYEIVIKLVRSLGIPVSDNFGDNFFKHEVEAPGQAGENRVWVKGCNWSGCFLTTIINIMINGLYWRYGFKIVTREAGLDLKFSENVRCKFLGDDNVIKVSHRASSAFNAVTYAAAVAKIGQLYTSDDKDSPLTEEFRAFEDITFLGAHPRIVNGTWSGALRKKTIEEALCWTRNNNQTLSFEVLQMLEYASQWEEDYWTELRNKLEKACRENEVDWLLEDGYRTLRRVVARRTAAQGHSFNTHLFAQSDLGHAQASANEMSEAETKASAEIANLTGLQQTCEPMRSVPRRLNQKVAKEAVGDPSMGTQFAVESFVLRKTFQWTPNQGAGQVINAFSVPFGILAEGEQQTMQNRQFDAFIYWRGGVQIAFQLNGNKFQQGYAVCYFRRLSTLAGDGPQVFMLDHRVFGPNSGCTYLLDIPYSHPRNVLNTFNRENFEEELGSVFFRVISPLKSVAMDPVTITVFARFPGTKFYLPRPLASAPVQKNKQGKIVRSFGDANQLEDDLGHAQGAQQSTTVNNSYNVVGDVSVETGDTGGEATGANVDTQIDAEIPMPMDNPMISNGAVPVFQTLPGMSRSNGLSYTYNMQLHPGARAKAKLSDYNEADDFMQYDTLLGKPQLEEVFPVDSTMAANTLVYSRNLIGGARYTDREPHQVTIRERMMDMFWFWHGDFEFDFTCVKTMLHNVRLRAVIAYGSPDAPTAGESTIFRNFLLDFTGDNTSSKFIVPYNASTPWLRTNSGPNQDNPVQDHSLGWLSLFVANPLNHPETVVNSVDVVVKVRLINGGLAVPRPLGLINPANTEFTIGENLFFGERNDPPLEQANLGKAQGKITDKMPGQKEEALAPENPLPIHPLIESTPEPAVVQEAPNPQPEADVEGEAEPVEVAGTKRSVGGRTLPGRLQRQDRFEYSPMYIIEVMRRFREFNNWTLEEGVVYENEEAEARIALVRKHRIHFPVRPAGELVSYFAGWKGGINYRLIVNANFSFNGIVPTVVFIPSGDVRAGPGDVFATGGFTFRTTLTFGDPPAEHIVTRRNLFDFTGYAQPVATETSWGHNGTMIMDFHIPFQTQFAYLRTDEAVGRVSIWLDGAASTVDASQVRLYSRVADDFSLGGFRGIDTMSYPSFSGSFFEPIAGLQL